MGLSFWEEKGSYMKKRRREKGREEEEEKEERYGSLWICMDAMMLYGTC